MEGRSSFYLTLPSNASFNVFPDNKATHFKVKLAKPVHLQGSWEVALVEVHYPNTWQNVDAKSNKFSFTTPYNTFEGELPVGHYKEVDDILDALRDEMDMNDDLLLRYNKRTKSIQVKAHEGFSVKFEGGLAHVLGFRPDVDLKNACTSDYEIDLSKGVYSMYMYTNMVSPQLVGDAYVPLLKIIGINKQRYGEVVSKEYNSPHYLPVETKEFDTVEVYITDDTGTPFSFAWGKVIAKVHFRRVAPLLRLN